MKIELYIDRQLCDIGDPSKFSVYLKRDFFNPTELNTKDAQASYSITLPASNTNNAIFTYTNVEEVRGKFDRLYDAELNVNGIRIFEGKFKLSEISTSQYKGNLGVPKPKTAKDIFGTKNMNQLGEWKLDLKKYNQKYGLGIDFISEINKDENPDCIFPFALYGLMPRNADIPPLYEKANQNDMFREAYNEKYKYIYDKDVRFGIEDFPPSVNCLKMLRTIFEEQDFHLTGSAFGDKKLQGLYVSYCNPNDYTQAWNWGDLGKMSVSAVWKTALRSSPSNYSHYERQIDFNDDDYGKYFNINLFNCNNLAVKEIKDSGTNVMYNEFEENYSDNLSQKYIRKSLNIIIPKSGYYKVRLTCHDFLLEYEMVGFGHYDSQSKRWFTQAYQKYQRHNDFRRSRYELQVMRDYGEGDFKNINLVGVFNKPQFPQTNAFDRDQYPKYYPYPNGPMVVDPCVNQNFVNGLRWGSSPQNGEWNPKDTMTDAQGDDKYVWARPNYMFIGNGFSWDKTFSQKTKILSAYDSSVYENGERLPSNYYKWGIVGMTKKKEPIEGEEDGEIVPEDDEDGDEGAVYDPNFDPNDTSDSDGYIIEEQQSWLNEQGYEIKERYAHFIDYSDHERGNYVTNSSENSILGGEGAVESIIWLERGERLAVCFAGDRADKNAKSKKTKMWDECVPMLRNLDFTLEVEPYRSDMEWNNFDSKGNCNLNQPLKWNEGVENGWVDNGFRKGSLNLIDFLPSSIRADEWIEQFCKAFNLSLTHTGGDNFELNTSHTNISSDTVRLIDIDDRAHVVERTNQDMALPSEYRLGFTVNDAEEGYCRSKEIVEANKDAALSIETGSGVLKTGSIETDVVTQSSNFSYCWYTQLSKINKPTDYPKYEYGHIQEWEGGRIPILSKFEVWETKGWDDYKDMVKKVYFDSAQRFWFKNGTLLSLPIGMQSTSVERTDDPAKTSTTIHQKKVDVAMVANTSLDENGLELTYEDKPNSITRNYFFVPDAGLAYTEVECFLMPDEYNRLGISLIRFNGSLYHAISIDGYDPTCLKPAKLKMMPKMKNI